MVLGTAVGVTALPPNMTVTRGVNVGVGAWLLGTLVVSGFAGGWIAAAAARAVRRRDGVLHGLVTWATVTVVGLILHGGAGGLLAGLGNIGRIAARAGDLSARRYAAIGSWVLFAALVLPLCASVVGGIIGAARERSVVGLGGERALGRRPIVAKRERPVELPTPQPPLPQT